MRYMWACHYLGKIFRLNLSRENERDLIQSYDKSPGLYQQNIQKPIDKVHKNASKNYVNAKIADRLRTISWINNSHQTGVGKPIYK